MNRLQSIKKRSEPPVGMLSSFEQQISFRSADAAVAESWLGTETSALLRKSVYPTKAWPWAVSDSDGVASSLVGFRRSLVWEDVTFVVLGLSGLAALVIAFCEV